MIRRIIAGAALSAVVLAAQATQVPSSVLRRGYVPSLNFVVHYRSIEPQQITVPEGPYDFHLNDGLFQGHLTYQLQDEAKALKSEEKDGEHGRAYQILQADLKPGRYLLTVKGGESRWKSLIIVVKR